MGDIARRTWSDDELEQLGVGSARLELVPRGVGRILVRAPQLYVETHPGEPVTVRLEIVNEGTRALANVEVEVEPPLGWGKTVEPALVQRLGVADEVPVELCFEPPEGSPVGKYEIRVRTTSFADGKPIEGEDKTVTVRLEARTSLAAPAILIALLLGTISVVVMVGIRIARR